MTIRLVLDAEPPPPSGPPPSGSSGTSSGTTAPAPAPAGGGSASAPSSPAVLAAGAQLQSIASREPVYANFEVIVAVAGTPQRLQSYRAPAGAQVEVRAKSNNTGPVYLGKTTRPRNGALSPGAGAVMLRPSDIPAYLSSGNLADYMVDADTNGDGIMIIVRWGGSQS